MKYYYISIRLMRTEDIDNTMPQVVDNYSTIMFTNSVLARSVYETVKNLLSNVVSSFAHYIQH